MRLARNAAFAKLLPLVWSQLRDQAEHYFEFLNMGQTVGLYTAEQMRAGEDLNGWLQLRTRETGEANEGTGTVRDAFCALSKNVLMIYKDEDAGVPDEILCLQASPPPPPAPTRAAGEQTRSERRGIRPRATC